MICLSEQALIYSVWGNTAMSSTSCKHADSPQKVAEKCEVAPLRPKIPQSRPTGEFLVDDFEFCR